MTREIVGALLCSCLIGIGLAAQSSSKEHFLFDGKTTNGWRGFKKPGFPEHGWVVEDGWLKKVAAKTGEPHGGGDIITDAVFDNFDLHFEWRVAPGANSGVKYFVTEDRSGPIAHEYQ